MAIVTVIGGTGTLGRELVPLLTARGDDVRVLSRREPPSPAASGVVHVRGDVITGAGLADAVRDADHVVFAVTGTSLTTMRRAEVDGMRHVLAACRPGTHLLHVSIVGVEHTAVAMPYYRAKLDAERLVEAAGLPWTIQRGTQFHPLLAAVMAKRVFPRTRNLRFQPVHPGDFAARIAEVLAAGPGGRVPDFGGPQVLSVRELAAIRKEVTGRSTLLVPLPAIGPLRALDAGHHLCPDHAAGTRGWREWLGG